MHTNSQFIWGTKTYVMGVINVTPDSFSGDGVKESEALKKAITFVDEGVDSGPIILQSVVKVRNNDNEKTLSKRILTEEHKIYPEAVKLFAKKKIHLSGKRAMLLD